jgi:hypothetical protein
VDSEAMFVGLSKKRELLSFVQSGMSGLR